MPGPALAARFQAHLLSDVDQLRSVYNPTLFLRMIGEHGGLGTAHRLLGGSSHTSYGFEKLWEMGQLERSLEFAVLLPWFRSLFSAEERDEAERRLILHQFPLEERLAARSASPPDWTASA